MEPPIQRPAVGTERHCWSGSDCSGSRCGVAPPVPHHVAVHHENANKSAQPAGLPCFSAAPYRGSWCLQAQQSRKSIVASRAGQGESFGLGECRRTATPRRKAHGARIVVMRPLLRHACMEQVAKNRPSTAAVACCFAQCAPSPCPSMVNSHSSHRRLCAVPCQPFS